MINRVIGMFLLALAGGVSAGFFIHAVKETDYHELP